jgi:hypothetical protein
MRFQQCDPLPVVLLLVIEFPGTEPRLLWSLRGT